MKKIKIKITPALADEIAKFIGENELRLLITWTETTGLFNDNVTIFCIIAYPDALQDRIEAKLQKYHSA